MSEPFTAFNFLVEIVLPGAPEPLCGAAFAECEGLELRFDVRTLREGGNPGAQVLLPGHASYGQVTLRRGMTPSFDLWDWCSAVLHDPGVRADAAITLLSDDREVRARFLLRRCLPVRLRAPRLDAVDGVIAIEELQLACEAMVHQRPDGDSPAPPSVSRKAELRELDSRLAREINPDRATEVQLNPQDLRVVTTVADGTRRRRLALELWFDVTLAGRGDDDVRRLTDRVAYFAGAQDGAPRPVRLQWGTFRFDGFVESLEEELDLFSPDGRPLRSRLALTMRAPS